MKSNTCFTINSGKPLSEYFSQDEAASSAAYILQMRAIELYPYECEVCQMWHLSPTGKSPITSRPCMNCQGSDLQPKMSYPSKEMAGKAMRKNTSFLKVYKCPVGNGWHLTSR